MSELYPSKENIYSAMYVHARVIEYAKLGHSCNIYKLNKKKNEEYLFENIKVYEGKQDYLKAKINENKFDIIVMHAPNPDEKYFVLNNFSNSNVICWMHGLDSVSGAFTYPYAGNKLLHPIRFLFRFKEDIRKIISWKKFINYFNPKIVVVSKWMKEEAERFLKIKLYNTIVIPNHIDEDIFQFKQRLGKVKSIVCIRPHSSAKYAIDLAIKSFSNSKYTLDIYGVGELIDYHKNMARDCNANVNFIEKMFNRDELSKILNKYDLAIMPTRHDTHGVIVCEMLLGGLPVITSEIGMGNSEYKTRGSIFLDNNNFEVEDIIDDINKHNKLDSMSKYAHEDMLILASKKVVITKELNEMEKLIK